jgi:hypothetical protein
MKKLVLKTVLGFAIAGYLVAVALGFAPRTWHPSPAFVLSFCPAASLTMATMTDPSFGEIALLIAPINAVFYSVLGFVIGLITAEIRRAK